MNKLTLLTITLLFNISTLFAQEIWIKSNTDGLEYNLTSGTPLKGCTDVSGLFSLRGVTYDEILWTFSGGTSIEDNPELLFQNKGIETITAQYKIGTDYFTVSASIEVTGIPSGSDFSLSTNEGCVGTTIQFTASTDFEYEEIRFLVDGNTIPNEGFHNFTSPGAYTVVMEGKTIDGCPFDVQRTNIINIAGDISFDITPKVGHDCSNSLEQTFTVLNGKTDVVYTWDFGDGTIEVSNNTAITHTFNSSSAETFTVKVIGEKGGCTFEQEAVVALNVGTDLFVINYPSSFCNTYTIQLQSQLPSSLDGQQIKWTFNDGTELVRTLPSTISRTFTNSGENITVTAEYDGCEETESFIVPDLLPNSISINAETQFCEDPYLVPVSVNNLGDLSIDYTLSWETSDGQTANGPTANFTFNGNNTKTIRLIATGNGSSCTIDEITVQSQPIVSTIQSNNGFRGCVGFTTTFSHISTLFGTTIDPSDINSVRWELYRDGTLINNSNTEDYTHTFNTHGNYKVLFYLENNKGCIVTVEEDIEIGYEVTPSFDVDKSPVCNYELATFTNTTPATTDFVALGINPNDVRYEWNYGNGWVGSYNGENTYANVEGDQTVQLRAIYNGCTGPVVSKIITVVPPVAEFTVDMDDLCQINSLTIENLSIGATEDYQWRVSVGTDEYNFTTSDLTPFKLYDKIAENIRPNEVYTIELTASNATCYDIYTLEYTPLANPALDITWSPDIDFALCANTTITFDPGDGIDASNATFLWTFYKDGNPYTFPGSPITEANPDIIFTEIGSYDVELEVNFTTPGSCMETQRVNDIKVFDIQVTGITGINSICLLDGSTPSLQEFNVDLSVDAIDYTTLTTFNWRWEVVGDNNNILHFEEGNDPSDLAEALDFEYDFNTPLNDQNDRYKVRFRLNSDACDYSFQKNIIVTEPTINFGDVDTHVNYAFECDYVVTTIDPKLDRSKLQRPHSASYKLFSENLTDGTRTEITDFTMDKSEANNVKFIINNLSAGEHKIWLQIEDKNNCSIEEALLLDVPELPIGIADFTPDVTALACRGSINFTDEANSLVGNSTPRKYVDGSEVPIKQWVWHITRDADLDLYLDTDEGILNYFFEAGIYNVSLMVVDEQNCTFTSDEIEITVGGVRGEFTISKRAGYAPFETHFVGTPSYASVNSGNIDYLWFSGDGRSETTDGELTLVYDSLPLNDRLATPGVIFIDEEGCRYPANPQGEINILTAPKRTVSDIERCIDEGNITIDYADPDFTVANIDNENYSYSGILSYQWYEEGNPISNVEGGNNSEVTFTYGKTGEAFMVNPDLEEGKQFIIESWIDAEYIDKANSANNHTERVAIRRDTLNVIFNAIPEAKLNDFDAICLNDILVLDGSNSDFGDYTRGSIDSYFWEIENWGDTLTTSPIIDIYLENAADYSIKLTVTSENTCTPSSIEKTVTVKPLPILAFSTSNVCFGEENLFTNTTTYEGVAINNSSPEIEKTVWYFNYGDKENEVIIEDFSPTFSFNSEGFHTVKMEVYTTNGCLDSLVKDIEVYSLPEVTTTEDSFICIGESITLNATGGNAYQWSSGSTNQNTLVTPTSDSTFYVEVMNENNCITLDSVQVFVIPGFSSEITFFEACEGESIQLDGTLLAYENTTEEMLWSTGETTNSIVVTESGTYEVSNTVTHISGKTCTFTKEIQVEFRPLPQALPTTLVHCFIDGPLKIQAEENPNYSYLWDTGETTSSISVNEVGIHTVTITDNTHPTLCEATSTVEIFDPETKADFTASQVCLGEFTTLDATISSIENEELAIEYHWTLGTFGDTVTTDPILNYSFQTYGSHNVQLRVQPVGGCSSETISKTVTVFELPKTSFTAEDVCLNIPAHFVNTSTFENILISSNDNKITSVQWDFNYDGTTPHFTNNEISPYHTFASAGTYSVFVQVTTENGCSTNYTDEITIHPLPEISITEDTYICYGESITLNVGGGVAYQWAHSDETSPTINVSPEVDEVYIVKVWNELGCESFDSVTVHVIPGIQDEITEIQICEGEEITLDGTIGEYQGVIENFVWSNGSTQPTIDVNVAGNYTVTNTVLHESGKECTFDRTFTVITRPMPPEFSNSDTTFCFRTGGEIEIVAPGNNSNFIYLWEDTEETTSSVFRDEEGIYTVKIIDTSFETACETNTSIQVVDLCPPQVFTPTAMTPNNDGLNDEFVIRSRYALNIKLNIFNRWGEIIFSREYQNSAEAREEGNGWNGMYRGKIVPGGVYTYTIDFISELDGSQHREANSITVIR